jgi:hypothetical protein
MRKKKEEFSQEKQSAFELKQLRENYRLNLEPTIKYKIGDRVQRGHVKFSIVTEILDNGTILKLHEIVTDTNYGNPIDHERDSYVLWHQIVPFHSFENDKKLASFIHKSDIRLNYSQRSLSSIFTTVYMFGLDFDPEYQRGNVWELKDKIALIDSIFNDVDIGKFVLIHKEFKLNETSYEVLDGKQRINTLIEFHESRFKYKDKFFHELSYRDQDHFEEHPISMAEIQNVTLKQKLEYFLRLNTSGKPQDVKHMKKIREIYSQI